MIKISIFLIFFTVILGESTFAQHHHSKSSSATSTPFSFVPVLSQQLSDPELKNYIMTSSVLTIVPGGIDTVSHRHDCELFGYVLEGAVQIGLEHKDPVTFKAGEIFYEKRNILHSLAANESKDEEAKVLLIFIIKEGREAYKREYPDKK